MQTITYQGLKINKQQLATVKDALVVEAPLQININKVPYTVIMRTPDNDIDLLRGLLFAEDIYKEKQNFSLEILKQENEISSIVNIQIAEHNLGKGYLNKRTLLSVSSCGICGKQELKDIKVTGNQILKYPFINASILKEMFFRMDEKQQTFRNSGGSHAAAIFNKDQELLAIKEDIGRHNAVDKSIGSLLINNQLKLANYLLVSGRVSYEIVTKAFIAKIPVIVAVSACSSLAVDFAKEFGICLIGFARDEKMTIYANPSYINTPQHG